MASEAATENDQLPKSAPESSTSIRASCHCGQVTIELPNPPERLNECRCSICYSYGALWAYYPRRDVLITAGETGSRYYVRKDDGCDGDISFHWCNNCGCMTHWWGEGDSEKRTGPNAKMGFNARMLPERDIEGVNRKVSYC